MKKKGKSKRKGKSKGVSKTGKKVLLTLKEEQIIRKHFWTWIKNGFWIFAGFIVLIIIILLLLSLLFG